MNKRAVLCFALLMCCVLASAAWSGPGLIKGSQGKASKQPRYVSGAVLVAVTGGSATSPGAEPRSLSSVPALSSLNAELGVKSIQHVFHPFAKAGAALSAAAAGLNGVYRVSYSAKIDPRAAAKLYAALPGVRYAEPDYIYHALATNPNDPYWSSSNSWGQGYRDQWDMVKMNCPAAWDVQKGSPSMIIAVIDTGIDYTHPDIKANIWTNPGEIPGNGIDDDGNGYVDDYYGYNFAAGTGDPMDGNGHGTHVAGTIGAVGNNGVGIAGINWSCKLMAVKGLDDSGSGSTSDLADAIRYATDEGARVINMSWGGPGYSQTIHDALIYAHDHNVVLCAAAGNDGSNFSSSFPASDNNVITVAASDPNDNICSFSSWGIKTAVAAPGGGADSATDPCSIYNCLSLRAGATDLLSSGCGSGVGIVGGNYYRLAGTSMACPHVAGLAGLILAQNPTWTAEQVRQAIQMQADDILTPGFDRYSGFGRIDAYKSVMSPEPMTAFISDPANGAPLWGTVAVNGTAAGPNFSGWVLDYGSGYEPATWTPIATGSSPVTAGLLANWDTTSVPPGVYSLRLRTTGTGNVLNADYRLEVDPSGAPPANDDCAAALVIPSLPYTGTMSTVAAGSAATDPVMPCANITGYNTVWYSFTPTAASGVVCNTTGSNYDTVLAVWTGSCGSLNSVACNDDSNGLVTSSLTFSATPGTTYLIEVASYDPGGGSQSVLNVSVSTGQDYFTQLFDPSTPFDLANKSITFTPDGSANFYSVCVAPILAFPTAPAGGTPLTLGDDDYSQVSLTGGAQVSLYGVSYGDFYVGSNGYITFGAGDTTYSESLASHFSLPRISGLFRDFAPQNAGTVSWQQTSDRVAVTYQNVPQFDNTDSNSFQIEMFFDGRIRLSYLSVATDSGLVGLSAGNGLPADFQESDLSNSQTCGGGGPPDYFTELFDTSPVDLSGKSISFMPDGSTNYYTACTESLTALPTDPSGGSALTLRDDGYAQVTLGSSSQVSLYGQSYGSFYVGSNGYITFGAGDSSRLQSLPDHFNMPRISALFCDLNPSAAGTVSWKQLSDRAVVTFQGVPNYGTADSNTFQIEMYFNGQITISYLGIGAQSALAGLSAGMGVPRDYTPSDLSQYVCARALRISSPNGGEWYEPGTTVPILWTASGSVWQPGDTVMLQYSPDAGTTWVQVPGAANLAYLAGSYMWNTAGLTPSDSYLVKVAFTADPTVYDTSDAPFHLKADTTPPVIVHTPLIDTGDTQGPYQVCATVTDNVGVASVTLNWSKNGGVFTAAPMTSSTPNVYCAGIPGPSVVGDQYSYYIQARDTSAAGNTARDPASGYHQFSIVSRPDYFTQMFGASPFDLSGLSIQFTPDRSISYYTACTQSITSLPVDPTGGSALSLSNDSYAQVSLQSGAVVSLYGQSYSTFYVGSNGYITFTSGDSARLDTLAAHFNMPRISALFDDLDPGSGGSVSWKQTADGVAVTFQGVPVFGQTAGNTFQIEMFFDGRISLSYLTVADSAGLAGLSAGKGVPADYQPSDLSTYAACGPLVRVLSPAGGEVFTPGTPVSIQWLAIGPGWQPSDTVSLDYSEDGGTTWTPVPNGSALTYNAGSFVWDTTGYAESAQYRVRVTSNSAASVSGQSPDFALSLPPGAPTVSDDGLWTTDLTQLHASWTPPASSFAIAEYQYAIGTQPTDPGSGYTVGWTSAGTGTQITRTGLSLTSGAEYYFYVKARNTLGQWGPVGVSDGILAVSQVYASPGAVKLLGDGVRVALAGLAVTATQAEMGGPMYLEAPDRSSGIAAIASLSVAEGDTVNITGMLSTTSDGERELISASAAVSGHGQVLAPLVMTLRNAASASFSYNATTGAGQMGVTDPPGEAVSTVGLLVSVSGRVMSLDSSFLYIDDGSWPGLSGVRVDRSNLPQTLTSQDFVAVTGISTVRKSGSVYELVIRPRNQDDLSIPASGLPPLTGP